MWWTVTSAWAQGAWPDGDQLLELVNAPAEGESTEALVAHYRLKKQKTDHALGAKGAGICLATDEAEVHSLWLQDDTDGNGECVAGTFAGTLPFGLRWGQSKVEVRALLGFGLRDAYEDRVTYGAGPDRFVSVAFRDDRLVSLRLTDGRGVDESAAQDVATDVTRWIPSALREVPGAAAGAARAAVPPAGSPAPTGDALVELLHQHPNRALPLITHWNLRDLEDRAFDLGAVGPGICLAVSRDEVTSLWLQSDPQGRGGCPGGAYPDALPLGLAWGMSSEEVQARLGRGVADGEALTWDAGGDRYVQAEFDRAGLVALQLSHAGHLRREVVEQLSAGEVGRLTVVASPAPVGSTGGRFAGAPTAGALPLPSIDTPVRTGAKAPTESAVVVGLESYPFLGAGVPFATRDAQAFADLMVYTRGLPQARVQLLTHGAREQILAAVDRAVAETPAGGTVWFYFAGHGAANPQTGDRALLGDDVRSDAAAFAARGVGVVELEERVTAKGLTARLVLDACYAGASRTGASILGGTRFAVPTYASAPKGNASQWNAAGPDQISGPLEPVQHGAFTYFAIGALRGWADGELDGTRDGRVTAAEAQAFVARALRTAGTNDQTPVWVGADDVPLSTGAEASPLR